MRLRRVKCVKHSIPFQAKYNGYFVVDILEQRLHTVFIQDGSTPNIAYDMLLEEIETSLEAGYAFYWYTASRETRALLIARRRIRQAIDAMTKWDMSHRPR